MNRHVGLLAGLLLSSMWLVGFTGGGCFGSDPGSGSSGSGGGEPPSACAGLDEEACVNDQGCSAVYETTDLPQDDCLCAPCEPGYDCGDCGCGGGFETTFARCEPRPTEPVCPAVGCEMYCEFGFALGADGCPTCSCNPGPTGECSWDGDCPDGFFCAYAGGTGGAGEDCLCPGCDPDGNCPPCDCGGGAAPAPSGVCLPYSPECRTDADCGAGGHCFDGGCFYDQGCTSDNECPADMYCQYGNGDPMPCDCDCDPADPSCGCACPGMPEPAGSCVPVEPQCRVDLDCGDGLCVNGFCQWQPMCASDYDCPGGYCEYGFGDGDCAEPDCGGARPGGGYCVFNSCDDGTEPMCDMIPPECAAGQTLAARNGCWECVDARTCQGQDACGGAWLDETGTCRGPADGALPPECCGVVCAQVVTYASDPRTGTCFAFATPCDVPAGWAPCAR